MLYTCTLSDWEQEIKTRCAEIAIPAFIVAKIRRIPTLYIECGAQVTPPSLTGRLLVRIADTFFVQWPELRKRYGKRAEYRGSLVDETPPGTLHFS